MPSSFYVVIDVDVKRDISLGCIDLFENSKQALLVSKFPALFKPCPQLNQHRHGCCEWLAFSVLASLSRTE